MDAPKDLASSPAAEKLQELPPALLDKIGDDPDEGRKLFRTYTTIAHHEVYARRKTMTPSQLLPWIQEWTKLGGMEPKKNEVAQNAASGYKLIINIGDRAQSFGGITVEHEPEPDLLPQRKPIANPFPVEDDA